MGKFRVAVNPGNQFYAIARTEEGLEKRFELPSISDAGWGITISKRDSALHYRVIKARNAVMPEELYVVIHCRGVLLGSNPIHGATRGKVDLKIIPEGISHIVLMDGEGNVYSQRLFFAKRHQRPELKISTRKPVHGCRELVEMEIDFEDACKGLLEGSFSLAVTDDQKVVQDTLEDHILSNLLLTSDLKGHVDHPAYCFNDTTPGVAADLDLVMMTHGWTRFDISKIAKGVFPPLHYPLEVGQVISGKVDNFWGKESAGANLVLISNRRHSRTITTDEQGEFLINGLAFRDSTSFLIRGTNIKGRKRVTVNVDKDEFLSPVYGLPNTMNIKK